MSGSTILHRQRICIKKVIRKNKEGKETFEIWEVQIAEFPL